MINAGRPLVFDWASKTFLNIVYTWWLGTEAGNSIGRCTLGKINPGGKLPMTFPRNCPVKFSIYYNHCNTGRPR